ncbi:oocyte zinc finger protein XlCOF7.1-like [Hippocampus zosterae]|uniref:oocyte zinc finger protein XlCOF7.1-like n=1 Tax=Hippocampus zosterae TaxID=109293 RepID=UPI00223D98D1|nr:oocyte zinc finger protein XlCOF7.1-like [Hippocampus zosterae]
MAEAHTRSSRGQAAEGGLGGCWRVAKRRRRRKARISRAAATASSERPLASSQNKIDMLKELVRERLLAAADEIFELFQTTVASYEQQLCRAREESERHRRQLEAICKTQIVIRVEDVNQLMGHREELPDVKLRSSASEQEYPRARRIKEEEEEAGVSALPRDGDSEESDHERDQRPEWSRLHPGSPSEDLRGSPPGENLLALLTDRDDAQDVLGSAADCEELEQTIGGREEPPSRRTGVRMKSEESEDEAPERSEYCRGSPRDELLAPMSDSDDADGPSPSDGDCEGEDKASRGSPKDKRSRKGNKCRTLKEHFSCSVCAKRFTCKSHWMRHVKTHTGEKSFCCSVCGKTFSRKEHMQLHMRTHTGEKPFRCSVCGVAFSVKQSMKKHMRRHTGEKPFSCSFCRTTFSRKESLDKHMRVHTGEKPFSCAVCGGSFAQRSNMTRHMQIHKKGE